MRRRFGSILRRRRKDGTHRPGYWVKWTDSSGRRRMRKGGTTRAEAERALDFLAGEKAAVEGVPLPLSGVGTLTIAELTPRILDAWRVLLAEGTFKGRASALRRWATRLSGKPVASITRMDVQAAINDLAGTWKASGVHTEVRILQAVYAVLRVSHGLEVESPCKGVSLPSVHLRPRPHLRPEDLARLLEAAPAGIRPMVRLLADAGLRPAELFRLTWREVSLELGALRLEMTKTYRTRTVPLTVEAKAALEALRAALPAPPAPTDPVFTVSEKAFREGFRAAAVQAGLPDLLPYGLRHAFASALLLEGAAPSVVRDILGHASIATTDRYLRSLPGDAPRAAILALSEARGAPTAD